MADPQGEAPRDGMIQGSWSSAIKQMFGTAYEAYDGNNAYSGSSPTAPISHVWFTGGHGTLTEIYWPTIDTPQVRDSQFLVSDGQGFFFEEKTDAQSQVTWIKSGVPAFHVLNSEKNGKFEIERTVFADPDRDAIIQHVKITRHVAGLKFFVLHKPNVGNTPMNDTAFASLSEAPGAGLYASESNQAQAVVSSVGWKAVSAGFSGALSDGWQDISKHFQMNSQYRTATNGNVVLTGQVNIPETASSDEFDLVIGFGTDIGSAHQSAVDAMNAGWQNQLNKYTSQWDMYQSSVKDLGVGANDGGKLFRASVAVMKSAEDKTYAGAIIASPTIPWGNHLTDGSTSYSTGGYHLIWPRDLYEMATSFLAFDDWHSALACLNYLRRIQLDSSADSQGQWQYSFRKHSKNGSWYQNSLVDGQHYWGGLQLDETAMPVILAYRMWQGNHVNWWDYWDMVKRAADFIADFGPWSPQERWEETFGASPSTIASEISALWVAAEFANAAQDFDRANRYRQTASSWTSKSGDNLDTWTFTTSGKQGRGRYYIRVAGAGSYDETWNPNGNSLFTIANGGGQYLEKDVTDAGFLELVRFGVRAALSQNILDSVSAVDASIRYDIPNIGPGFHRYFGDAYNYDDVSGNQTGGMIWPILSGERAHFELQKAIEGKMTGSQLDGVVSPWVTAMERFATPQLMIPEQVWEQGPAQGQSTGSATPLGWSHGEYVKLLRSRIDQAVFDRIPVVVLGSGSR